MNRKKNRVADAVTMDLWGVPVQENKEPEINGPCEICGKSTIMDLCSDGTPSSMVLCSPACAAKYIEMYDKVLEPVEIVAEELPMEELPMEALPTEDSFEDALPVFENPWHKGFVEKEGEVSKERYELVTQSMNNKYIGAYLILHPDIEINELETRIDPHYVVWIDKKHNSFCNEKGIVRREGYSSADILDFHEFLFRPIEKSIAS